MLSQRNVLVPALSSLPPRGSPPLACSMRKNARGSGGAISARMRAMEIVTPPDAASAAGRVISRRDAVQPPAVVRGWLYDSTEHWWALLVGAPPAFA